jgi:hypothetical protein
MFYPNTNINSARFKELAVVPVPVPVSRVPTVAVYLLFRNYVLAKTSAGI